MCVNPRFLPNGQQIPCQSCWQCRERRMNDWVGRCIAESKTAAYTSVGTLTYGYDDHYEIDHYHARRLVYEDVQKFLKLMRKNGAPLRYFVAGEYGTEKGRSHWHIIAFWQETLPPNYKELVRYDHFGLGGKKLWHHGFSYWEKADLPSMKYVMKYILKAYDDRESERRYGLSRMPPLGADYFRLMALQYVEQGLSPQDLAYGFPESRHKDGSFVRYILRGASAYQFLNTFDVEWQMRHHNQDWPQSDLMDAYVDERERKKRRALGSSDVPEDEFAARFELERWEKSKSWAVPIEGIANALQRRLRLEKQFARNRANFG